MASFFSAEFPEVAMTIVQTAILIVLYALVLSLRNIGIHHKVNKRRLLAEVALVVDGSVGVADEAVVGIDIGLAFASASSEAATVYKHHPLKSQYAFPSSSSSQSRFFVQFSSVSVSSNNCDTPSISVLELQIKRVQVLLPKT